MLRESYGRDFAVDLLDLLRRVGFKRVELLHENFCFAAFGALKSSSVG